MNKQDNSVLGIDIGSTKICVAICDINDRGELNLKGIGTSVTAGIQKNGSCDGLELQASIERAIKRAEQESGMCPTQVMINLPFHNIQFSRNLGVLISKEESGQITEADRVECVRRSRNIVKSPDQKMIHAIPLEYSVDGTVVQSPVDVFGRNLEVHSQIVLAPSDTILAVSKAVRGLQLTLSGLVYDSLGLAQIVLTEDERRNGAVLVDIGGRYTKVSVFKSQSIEYAFILPIGGETLSADLSKCLSVGVPEAERIKIIYGDLNLEDLDPNDTLEVNTLTEGRKHIKKILVNQILEARIKELFSIIKTKIPESALGDDAQFVLAGGGSLLKHLPKYVQELLQVPVREGLPEDIKPIIESSAYGSAVGLIFYGLKTQAIRSPSYTVKSRWLSKLKKKWADLVHA